MAAALTLIGSLTACGDPAPEVAPKEGGEQQTDGETDTDDGQTTPERIPDSKYMVEGMKLRPGIKLVKFTAGEKADFQGEPGEKLVTLTKSAFEKADEEDLDKHDILMGPGFAYQAEQVTPRGDTYDVVLKKMRLVEVIYGEWEEEYTIEFKPKDLETRSDGLRTKRGTLEWDETKNLLDVDFSFRKPSLVPIEAGGGPSWPVSEREGVDRDNDGHNSVFDENPGSEVNAQVNAAISKFEADVDFQVPLTVKVKWDGRIDQFKSDENYECENEQKLGPFKYCIDHFSLEFVLEPEADINVDMQATSSIGLTAMHDFALEDRFELIRVPLGSTGLAVRLAPTLKAGFEAAVTGQVGIESETSGSAKFPLGAEYNGETGRFEVVNGNESNFRHRWRLKPPAEAAIYGGFFVTPGLRASLVPSVGDFLEVQGIEFTGKIAPRLWYRLSTEVDYCVMWGVLFTPSIRAYLEVRGEVGWGPLKVASSWGIANEGISWSPSCTPGPDDRPEQWCLLEPEGHGGGKFCPGGESDPAENDGTEWQESSGEGKSDNDAPGGSTGGVQPERKDLGDVHPDANLPFSIIAEWPASTDLNLQVQTPLGRVVNVENPNGPNGGELLRDGCNPERCSEYEPPYREVVRWDGAPKKGQYEIWVVNSNGQAASDVNFRVVSGTADLKAVQGDIIGESDVPGNQRYYFQVK